MKFIGYEGENPVFMMLDEGGETSNVKLLQLDQSSGQAKPLAMDVGIVRDILSYTNGKLVTISQYGEVEVTTQSSKPQIRLQEGLSDEDDFIEKTTGYSSRWQVANISFTADGNSLF